MEDKIISTKTKKKTGQPEQKGFSLMELLIAMSIIGILAAVVLVSVQNYRKRARASRAATQLASVIPGISVCFMNGGDVEDPDSGDDICTEESTYGQWPDISGAPGNYDYTDEFDFSGPRDWYFRAQSDSSDDDITICCNSAMNSCENIGDEDVDCDQTTTW